MSLEGVVRNGVVVTDEPLALPEGTRVRIEVEPAAASSPLRRQGGWWRDQIHIAPDFDELPRDVAQAFGMEDE